MPYCASGAHLDLACDIESAVMCALIPFGFHFHSLPFPLFCIQVLSCSFGPLLTVSALAGEPLKRRRRAGPSEGMAKRHRTEFCIKATPTSDVGEAHVMHADSQQATNDSEGHAIAASATPTIDRYSAEMVRTVQACPLQMFSTFGVRVLETHTMGFGMRRHQHPTSTFA